MHRLLVFLLCCCLLTSNLGASAGPILPATGMVSCAVCATLPFPAAAVSSNTNSPGKAPSTAASNSSSSSSKKKDERSGRTLLTGKPVKEKKIPRLMKELKRKPYEESKARRFEIVFFVSLPVTLWLTYTMMEMLVGNTRDKNNPNRELQTAHYVYMLSSSLVTSFYIAYQDSLMYNPPSTSNTAQRELHFQLPIVGIRF